MSGKPRVNNLILQVVEKQLHDDTPKETRLALARLMDEGYSEEDSKHLIGKVITVEMRNVLKTSKPFDGERFADLLRKLPELPEE